MLLAAAGGTRVVNARAGERAPVTMPLQYTDARVYVPVRVAPHDSARWFILDTGALPTIVDATLARALHLQVSDAGTTSGAGSGTTREGRTAPLTLDVGGAALDVCRPIIAPLDSLLAPSSGRHVAGLVGSQLFEEHVVDVDFDRGTVQLLDPATFEYHGTGAIVPLHVSNGVPMADATLAVPGRAPVPMHVLVDLGAKATLLVAEPFIKRESLRGAFANSVTEPLGAGMGGETRYAFVRAPRITVSTTNGVPVEARDVVAGLSVAHTLRATWYDALLGAAFLHRYHVIFDYARQRLILEQRHEADTGADFDMSGAFLVASGPALDRAVVRDVVPGSPADVAGVRSGDVVADVDGHSTRELGLDGVRAALRGGDGTTVTLTLERDGARQTTRLRLRRLL